MISVTRRSPPGGAFSKPWPASTRSSSCSRTSTVLTAGSSTSSSTCSNGLGTYGFSSSAPHEPRRSPRRDRAGAGAPSGVKRELPTTIELWPLSRQEAGRLVAHARGARDRKETKTAIVGAASGNPLYAVEYVRMLEDRPGEELGLPGDGPGDHRVASRLALGQGQGTSSGRGGGRPGRVARGAGRDRRTLQGVG